LIGWRKRKSCLRRAFSARVRSLAAAATRRQPATRCLRAPTKGRWTLPSRDLALIPKEASSSTLTIFPYGDQLCRECLTPSAAPSGCVIPPPSRTIPSTFLAWASPSTIPGTLSSDQWGMGEASKAVGGSGDSPIEPLKIHS